MESVSDLALQHRTGMGEYTWIGGLATNTNKAHQRSRDVPNGKKKTAADSLPAFTTQGMQGMRVDEPS